MFFTSPAIKRFGQDLSHAYWILLKLMVPALVIVKILQELGVTTWLATALAPLMSLMGLPSELGLVWAAGMLTNIYTAMAVFYELGQGQTYTIGQVTTLGMLILISHALPVEGAVAKVAGVPWRLTLFLRIVGAFVLGVITHLVYRLSDYDDQAATFLWQPAPQQSSWLAWGWEQIKMLATIFVILAALMLFLRGLRLIGFERVLHWLLGPFMRLLRVNKEASDVTIIGLMLGLSFGAGLLISESRANRISPRDMKIVICFLGLCHSIIEDTLLILLLGADIYAVLWGRLIFAFAIMMIITPYVFPRRDEARTDSG